MTATDPGGVLPTRRPPHGGVLPQASSSTRRPPRVAGGGLLHGGSRPELWAPGGGAGSGGAPPLLPPPPTLGSLSMYLSLSLSSISLCLPFFPQVVAAAVVVAATAWCWRCGVVAAPGSVLVVACGGRRRGPMTFFLVSMFFCRAPKHRTAKMYFLFFHEFILSCAGKPHGKQCLPCAQNKAHGKQPLPSGYLSCSLYRAYVDNTHGKGRRALLGLHRAPGAHGSVGALEATHACDVYCSSINQ